MYATIYLIFQLAILYSLTVEENNFPGKTQNILMKFIFFPGFPAEK